MGVLSQKMFCCLYPRTLETNVNEMEISTLNFSIRAGISTQFALGNTHTYIPIQTNGRFVKVSPKVFSLPSVSHPCRTRPVRGG